MPYSRVLIPADCHMAASQGEYCNERVKMVFLIQNTQNRDTTAIQIKLDELIRALEGAHNALLDLEELTDSDLEHIRTEYERLAEEAREALRKGKQDTGKPEMKIMCG